MPGSVLSVDDPTSTVARAVADPTRRRILHLVRDHERTVNDLAEHFTVSRPAVSQHLRVLADAELVSVRRDGTRRWYRARAEGLVELRAWLDEFWTSRLDELKRAVETDHPRPPRSE